LLHCVGILGCLLMRIYLMHLVFCSSYSCKIVYCCLLALHWWYRISTYYVPVWWVFEIVMKIDTNTCSNILKHKHDLQKYIENIWNQLKQGIDNIINWWYRISTYYVPVWWVFEIVIVVSCSLPSLVQN
jgi:hypothetical protein